MSARLTLLLLLGLAACSDEQTTGPAPLTDRIQIVAGAEQVAAQGAPLAQQVVVRLVDAQGAPVANQRVTWRVVEGGGLLTSADSITSANGEARASWQLGLSVGQNLLLVSTSGATLTVRARSERRFIEVVASGRSTCALSTIGEAYCWGSNESAQLGDGTITDRNIPVKVRSSFRFKALAAGWSHTCGIATTGNVLCWGDNRENQLGTTITGTLSVVPVQVDGVSGATFITAGFLHTCALTTSGEAYCWGGNGLRQLGTGSAAPGATATKVATAERFDVISAGEFHTCAVAKDGVAYCWGWSSTGEVGDGGPFDVVQPVPVRAGDGPDGIYRWIGAGARHTCAAAVSGATYCWGRSATGEIGTPPFHHYSIPIKLGGPAVSFDRVGAGNVLSCGLTSEQAGSRSVYCWGSDTFNKYGEQPVRIFTGAGNSLAVGYEHVCSISEGAVWCWGSNANGRLGVSGIAGSAAPVKVAFPGS